MARRQDDMFPWRPFPTKVCNGEITVDNDVFRFDSLGVRQVNPDRRAFTAEVSLGLA